ncbi:hypothetical protein Nepgr_012245 [Nepenthes gracilis]|uniref:F-box domain-containing protein n=1 Tax=Nepenthes gracilis TaxID=150966 RepID=A0AAD3SGN4_NEPGR|nr:hypothetical protein Nepgr_012245 [Nepenthes gracilis]
MSSKACSSSLLIYLPDDILAIVSRSLSASDICNLSLCCRSLNNLANSDKVWLTQCEIIGVVTHKDLLEWRKGVLSYKALCRFLFTVKPLIGTWVHQNPELGNVVYVMPGFVSVVGCRIIPQELGPLGMEDGPILWAPVFEIIGDDDGSTAFILHGREKDHDYIYPGSVKSIQKACNVLLLEVEQKKQNEEKRFVHSKSFDHLSDGELESKICISDRAISRSQRLAEQDVLTVPFSKLSFGDRRKLLEIVTSQVRLEVPESSHKLLFPCLRENEERFREDMLHLYERRSMLMKMHKLGIDCLDCTSDKVPPHLSQLELSEIRKILDSSSNLLDLSSWDKSRTQSTKRRTISEYFSFGIRHMLKRSSSINSIGGIMKNSCPNSESKHARLHEFLSTGDSIGLTFHASSMKLTSYRTWPNMHDSRFALYKLSTCMPVAGQEYTGLWGGTMGWPPGRPTEDKPGKALFLLVLSYHEESPGQRCLIATKILEGTHYVLHPNGSAMFMVNVNEPSLDVFPWNMGADCLPVHVKHAFAGEGIANGYGFRYPGSKPGSLFVLQDGMLAFVWKESRATLTLQRLNLHDLLKKGERVPTLPPIDNFSYLTQSYSNVFTGFSFLSGKGMAHKQCST